MKLYLRVQELLASEVPLLPLTYWRSHWLIKPWVKRYPLSVLGDHYWQDVVLDSH
jgi:ABC-type oligopeptide transport system substrate-binding subunit